MKLFAGNEITLFMNFSLCQFYNTSPEEKDITSNTSHYLLNIKVGLSHLQEFFQDATKFYFKAFQAFKTVSGT